MVGVKALVTPYKSDEFFGIRQVDDIVGISGNHFYHFDPVSTDFEIDDFVGTNLTELDQAASADYYKLLILSMANAVLW